MILRAAMAGMAILFLSPASIDAETLDEIMTKADQGDRTSQKNLGVIFEVNGTMLTDDDREIGAEVGVTSYAVPC